MTTTVTVLVGGNKKCVVEVLEGSGGGSSYPLREVMPNSFTTVNIHGEQRVTVTETGDFLQ